MEVINRAVAIIKPRQPYLDWAQQLADPPDRLSLADLRRDCTAILLPEWDDPADAEAFIQDMFADVFAMELDAWHRDPQAWPAHRSYQIFREWFDVELHSLVLDAAVADITREAY